MKIVRKIRLITYFLTIGLIVQSCSKNDKFFIEKNRVGAITQKTQIKDLENIFKKDSIIIENNSETTENIDNNYYQGDSKYIIFEKGGKHLLTIVPMSANDSSTIKSIEIFDNRYKTKKGISLYSPYKDINAAYNITITNTILSAHIDIDELNATMAIDKRDIGINEFNRDEIKPSQIPDLAKIRHFTIWFN